MKRMRIYIDTSVFGGCFDLEFMRDSNLLFDAFESKLYIPVISEVTVAEIKNAPQKVRDKLVNLENIEILKINSEIEKLAEQYLKHRIITIKYAGDALHIAAATANNADVLVSWNFKHIVNLRKIHQFNAVNKKEGYPLLEIRTPQEVIENE